MALTESVEKGKESFKKKIPKEKIEKGRGEDVNVEIAKEKNIKNEKKN